MVVVVVVVAAVVEEEGPEAGVEDLSRVGFDPEG